MKQKIAAGHLTPYDIIETRDGSIGCVLSHDLDAGAVWISTANKIMPVASDEIVVRLLNITDFTCEIVRHPELLTRVAPSFERLRVVR